MIKSGWLSWCVVLLGMVACTTPTEPVNLPVPTDEDPAITIVSPDNPRFLLRTGESTEITFKLIDRESLALLRLVPMVFDESDNLVVEEDPIDIALSGTETNYVYTINAPTYPPFYKIKYVSYVLDSKGAFAETFFWVSILPPPGDPEVFQVLTYTNDTLVNGLSDSLYAMNLSARQRLPSMPGMDFNSLRLQMDIAETSGSGQGDWEPRLTSPNNNALGQDSIFAITDASKFNYEEATYTTIFEAFFSFAQPSVETPVLSVGDYVIVRLVKAPKPQFAILRIKELVNDGFGVNVKDLMIFDYKVTSQ